MNKPIFKCELCGNEDKIYIGYRNGKPYCRRCISFIGENADKAKISHSSFGYLKLDYKLSDDQKRISKKVLENYIKNENTLIYAVTGAGKTELVYEVIEYCLKRGKQVGFVIPRRDVVIELYKRIKGAFKNYKVIAVYGGNTNDLEGQLICLTSHQLYRYKNFFDLLIMDEIDAFPYKDNFTLNSFFKRAVKGNYILMSATPSEKLKEEFSKKGNNMVKPFKRYHGENLPVPRLILLPLPIGFIYLVYKTLKFQKEKKPVLIFTPTISECEFLRKLLKYSVSKGFLVHSKRKDRLETIEKFRKNEYDYLVTTAVLERGVTLKNLQVIIFNASSYIYDKDTLVQISGRVGRVIGATKGEVIYISNKKTEAIKESINDIKRFNK